MKISLFGSLALGAVLCLAPLQAQKAPTVVTKTYVAKYHGPVSEKEWKSRGQHGQVISVYSNGVVVTENYLEGKKHGLTTTSFPHRTTPSYSQTFHQDKVVEESFHYPSGRVSMMNQYNGEGELVGQHKWYSDGTPQSQETFAQEKLLAGKYHTVQREKESHVVDGKGVRVVRDSKGNLLSKEEVLNGECRERTLYFPNGEPSAIETYQNGQLHGTRKTYDTGGVPLSIEQWKNGKKEGMSTSFHNGEPIAYTPYQADKKHGVEKLYQEDQTLLQEISWKNGHRHGPSTMYIDQKAYTEWYFKGRKVSKIGYEIRSKTALTD